MRSSSTAPSSFWCTDCFFLKTAVPHLELFAHPGRHFYILTAGNSHLFLPFLPMKRKNKNWRSRHQGWALPGTMDITRVPVLPTSVCQVTVFLGGGSTSDIGVLVTLLGCVRTCGALSGFVGTPTSKATMVLSGFVGICCWIYFFLGGGGSMFHIFTLEYHLHVNQKRTPTFNNDR